MLRDPENSGYPTLASLNITFQEGWFLAFEKDPHSVVFLVGTLETPLGSRRQITLEAATWRFPSTGNGRREPWSTSGIAVGYSRPVSLAVTSEKAMCSPSWAFGPKMYPFWMASPVTSENNNTLVFRAPLTTVGPASARVSETVAIAQVQSTAIAGLDTGSKLISGHGGGPLQQTDQTDLSHNQTTIPTINSCGNPPS